MLFQGYLRVIKCCIVVGEIQEADKNLRIVLKLDPNNASITAEQNNLIALRNAFTGVETSYSNKDYRQVSRTFYRSLNFIT